MAEQEYVRSKHVRAWLAKYAEQGEQVSAWAEGYIGKMMGSGKDKQHNGALIITGRRVIFYRSGFLGEVHQAIPLAKISSVEQSSFLGQRKVRMHTSHDDLEFTTFDDNPYARVVAALQAGAVNKGEGAGGVGDVAAAGAAGPAGSDTPLDALKKLGELRAAGVINEAEFEAKKAELLGRM